MTDHEDVLEALSEAIYAALVDHPYHCQEPCCAFSEDREEAFVTLVEDVTREAASALAALAAPVPAPSGEGEQ